MEEKLKQLRLLQVFWCCFKLLVVIAVIVGANCIKLLIGASFPGLNKNIHRVYNSQDKFLDSVRNGRE